MRDINIVKSQYRMPVTLHQKLVAAAKQNGNRMNAELNLRIAQSFEHDERIDLVQRFNAMTTTINALSKTIEQQQQLQQLQLQQRDAQLIDILLSVLHDSGLLESAESKKAITDKVSELLRGNFT